MNFKIEQDEKGSKSIKFIKNYRVYTSVHGPYSFLMLKNLMDNDKIQKIFKSCSFTFTVSKEIQDNLNSLNISSLILPNSINTDSYLYKPKNINSLNWALVNRQIDLKNKTNNIDKVLIDLNKFKIKKLDIYGDFYDLDTLNDFMKENNINYNIEIKGVSDKLNINLNQNDYCVILAMGRCLLEGLSVGLIGLLTSYDGIKCFVNKNNFNDMCKYNFSGRNLKNTDISQLANEFKNINQNLDNYLLHDIVYTNFNIKNIGKKYIEILSKCKI